MFKELYKEYIKELNKLKEASYEVTNQNKIILNALLLSIFIISAPVVLLINFAIIYVFNNLSLFLFLFLLTFYVFDISIRLFYYQQMENEAKNKFNYKVILLFKALFQSLIYLSVFILALILL